MIELKPGDVFFVMHHDNKISKLFGWFMKSRWSHCGIVYEVTPKTVFTLETTDFEVVHRQITDYLNDPFVEMEILRNDSIYKAELENIVNGANQVRGSLYAYGVLD